MRLIFRIGLLLLSIFIAALIAGSGYEALQRHLARENHQPPGEMVNVGDRRIQLNCTGSGSPTIVFESGLGISGSLDWSAIQPSVSKVTRACSYSRAGIMWSDRSTGMQDAKSVAGDLHRALQVAGERAPFVLVGQSLGGAYIMNFTGFYPAEVSGLVFVDASHPDQLQRLQKVMPSVDTRLPKLGASLSWTGVVRALAPGMVQRAPNQSDADYRAIVAYAPMSLGPMLQENDSLPATLAQAGRFRNLGSRPIYVLTATAPFSAAALKSMHITAVQGQQVREIWTQLQNDEASWSSNSRHEFVDSDHDIQFERPDVVIKAALSVVHEVRSRAQL
ncbi:alpha/beta fold hydrolase [Paraburkholderia nodosa]|uniref:alpha/beta fold hydrolase n=1 Tax=Paraburkholderia nodosa TaxID=392320 RepID=UPI000481B853|nr:alpha/beta hydrolase [Paraburkholderia nodosa]